MDVGKRYGHHVKIHYKRSSAEGYLKGSWKGSRGEIVSGAKNTIFGKITNIFKTFITEMTDSVCVFVCVCMKIFQVKSNRLLTILH